MRSRWTLGGICTLLALVGADPAKPVAPKSPKATDALRIDAAAIRKAQQAYWSACVTADRRLATELKTAADLAHKRNDGEEERACSDAAKEAENRASDESMGFQSAAPAQPVKPFAFE